MTTQPSNPQPTSDDELRAIFRDLAYSAVNADEAAVLLATCEELAERGYALNADETDWILRTATA